MTLDFVNRGERERERGKKKDGARVFSPIREN